MYQDPQDKVPVEEWLRELRKGAGPKAVQKVLATVDLLRAEGLGDTVPEGEVRKAERRMADDQRRRKRG